ncbi:MAG: ATP-binding cassette domain-containing protein [Propionibacteriales bacterium]|nr:ATP-binding cassette domain-containing protein [Propionibacteriales bacterium]
MTTNSIETTHLELTYGMVKAVAGLDLAVRRGEIYGILGPNGAGKSTTVRILCTLLRPSAGTAVVAGHDVVQDPVAVRMRIGAALQSTSLDPLLTGRELLILQGRFYGMTANQVAARLEDLRDVLALDEALDRRIGTYSGGMKRRVDIVGALMANPEVLFLDEPTTGLDPESRRRIWREVKRLNAECGMTIVLTTQYLEEADVLADRVGIIAKGQLIAEGTPEQLKRSIGLDLIIIRGDQGNVRQIQHVLSGLPGIERIDSVGREVTVQVANGPAFVSSIAVRLAEAGVTVRDLTLRTPTLDDVFLKLTGAWMHDKEQAA